MGEGGEKEGSVDVTYVVGVGHRFGQKYVNGKNFANPTIFTTPKEECYPYCKLHDYS